LSVGGSDEPAKREADRVAAQVVDGSSPSVAGLPIATPAVTPLGSSDSGAPLDDVTLGAPRGQRTED
jgi:hypothetical protein